MELDNRAVSVRYRIGEHGSGWIRLRPEPMPDSVMRGNAAHGWYVEIGKVYNGRGNPGYVLRIIHPDRARSVTITTNTPAGGDRYDAVFGRSVADLLHGRSIGAYPACAQRLFEHYWPQPTRPRDVHVAAAELIWVAEGMSVAERSHWLAHPYWGGQPDHTIYLINSANEIAALSAAGADPHPVHEFLLDFQSCRNDGEGLSRGSLSTDPHLLAALIAKGWTGSQVYRLLDATTSEDEQGCEHFTLEINPRELDPRWLRLSPRVAVAAAESGMTAREALRALHDGVDEESLLLVSSLR